MSKETPRSREEGNLSPGFSAPGRVQMPATVGFSGEGPRPLDTSPGLSASAIQQAQRAAMERGEMVPAPALPGFVPQGYPSGPAPSRAQRETPKIPHPAQVLCALLSSPEEVRRIYAGIGRFFPTFPEGGAAIFVSYALWVAGYPLPFEFAPQRLVDSLRGKGWRLLPASKEPPKPADLYCVLRADGSIEELGIVAGVQVSRGAGPGETITAGTEFAGDASGPETAPAFFLAANHLLGETARRRRRLVQGDHEGGAVDFWVRYTCKTC